jgi:hypothetical protein
VFKRYYGEEIAAQFSSLFREHLVIAAQLVKAAKAGNNQAATEAEKKWYSNADAFHKLVQLLGHVYFRKITYDLCCFYKTNRS